MEDLTDFLIDVFANVYRKFKINAGLILFCGILSGFLFIPYLRQFLPLDPSEYMLLKLCLVPASFFFIKIFILTIQETEINFSTFPSIFIGLGSPFIVFPLVVIFFGGLVFTGISPFLFPDFAETHVTAVFCAAIVAAIMIPLFFPLALTALVFAYEGNSITGSFAAAAKLFSRGSGRLYFLTFFLLLCSLVLKLTHIGIIFVLPLVIMTMAQAKESMLRLDEEKAYEENAKKGKYYRAREFSKNYTGYADDDHVSENGRGRAVFSEADKGAFGFQRSPNGAAERAPEIELPTMSKIASKMVSASEHREQSEKQEDEMLNMGDIIDLDAGIEEDGLPQEALQPEEEEQERKEVIDIDMEMEAEKYPKARSEKKEYKSGKEYIDSFGNIKRKTQTHVDPQQVQQRTKTATSYIDNFGIIKRKK